MNSEGTVEISEGDDNVFHVVGVVVGEARVIDTKSRVPLCQFRIKNTRTFVNRHEVSEFDVEAWGRLGDWCGHDLRDGDKIQLKGRLKQDRWTDRLGRFNAKMKLVADHVEVIARGQA